MIRLRLLPVVTAALISSAVGPFVSFSRAHDAGSQMANVAGAFLDSLTPEQRQKATFEFADEERENWHFIPRERKGLPMKEMTAQQRLLAMALLNSGLGFRGAAKAMTIMSLEEVLYQMEGAGGDEAKRAATREKRDPEKYYVSIFGKPEPKGTWGWRIEGHHISMNFTLKDGNLIRATPSFFGSNPGVVREGPLTGLRVLATEEELGRSLVKSLTPEQAAKAIYDATAPKEMVTAAEHRVTPLSPAGLSSAEMTAEQKDNLHRIIREYIDRLRPEIAAEAQAEIDASGEISFAWAGGKELGEPHYYRVQGKTFLLEYDNTQNNANHVHSVWRSFDGDFGADILAQHLKAEHGK
ncbi:MAG: DUF3500 domain-containing protein [Verrucomicrobiales bacterium]|nr:DUF3500 domain-containing protein [Verrucomicrobiales bacterium]MCP5557484.1 DUF3500 domain-containing protein [Verrucomicrobiaceae bacterium]